MKRKTVAVRRCSLGKGVFAVKPFRAGERILTFSGKALTLAQANSRRLSRHCLQVGRDKTLLVRPPGRYVNHSCAPNAGLKTAAGLFALREIAAGSEITFDYSTCVAEAGWTMDCACASPRCRRTLVEFRKLAPRTRLRFAAPAWIRR